MSKNHYTMFCLPPAGCNANIYFHWKNMLAENCQLVALEYPGHGRKLSQKLITDVDVLATHFLSEILPHTNQPFILFGHSLGGGLIWKIIEQLQQQNAVQHLKLVVVSSRPAPSHSAHICGKQDLDDAGLLREIKKYNYLPETVLNTPSLLQYCLKILRHDFGLSDQLIHASTPKIVQPLLVVYGDCDPDLPDEAMLSAWQNYTTQWQGHYEVAGDHFYFRNEQSLRQMLQHMTAVVGQCEYR